MNVLVVGVGNILMGDDGVGVRVVHEISRRFHLPEGVEILDGGTSGLELLSYFSDRELVIIVDAVKSGLPPGTVVKELRLDLSEEVETNFEKLIDTVRNELECSGCVLKIRTGSGQEEKNIWDDR
jgi:Ni,Fe-hydrogenase maturation factor